MRESGSSSTNPPAVPVRHRFTVEQFHRMAETGVLDPQVRVELIDGEIIEMTPIGAGHAGTVTRATGVFSRGLGGRAEVSVQNPVILDGTSEPQPDLVLLRPKPSSYTDAHPVPEDIFLVVEVSDTTLLYDRNIKLPRYAAAGVREVWIIDLGARTVEVCRRPHSGNYTERRILHKGESLSVEALPGWEGLVEDFLV